MLIVFIFTFFGLYKTATRADYTPGQRIVGHLTILASGGLLSFIVAHHYTGSLWALALLLLLWCLAPSLIKAGGRWFDRRRLARLLSEQL